MDEKTIITGLIMFSLFFLKDIFNSRATKKDIALVQTNIDNANKKSEEAHKIASEAITEQTEIKSNYLDRFDQIKGTMNTNHAETLKELRNLSTDLNRNFVQKSECPFIHAKAEGVR